MNPWYYGVNKAKYDTLGDRCSFFVTAYFFFFCIVLSTISSSKTSASVIVIIDILRNIVASLVVIFGLLNIFLILKRNKITKLNLGVLIFAAFFFSYGLALSVINGGFQYFESDPKLFLFSLISILFCLSIGSVMNNDDTDSFLKKHLILYFLFLIALNLYQGGLIIDNPPRFLYEYDDETVTYSQGITSLFMIAALSSMTLMLQRDNNLFNEAVSFFLILVFISLSFLGAARGDFVFGFIIIFFVLLFRKFKYIIVAGLFLFGMFMFLNLSIDDLMDSFLLFRRLELVTTGDFGLRDVLTQQSLMLIYESPGCLLFGCGFGYFQKFYGYEYGMYPHNIYLEFIITFGLPIALVTMLLLVIGIKRVIKINGFSNLITIIGLYVIMIGLKSGSLIGFMTVGYLAYFTTNGVLSFVDPHIQPSRSDVAMKLDGHQRRSLR